ncbi:MAG: DUF1488 family protein [Ramlibacter sp.]|nr:DUF1488 family protein [Ramlibacter sp.]
MSDADAPFFHDASATVRFWIVVDGTPLGASVGSQALHHRFRPNAQGDDPLETYLAHATEIEAAVRRRLAQGSREPVMLREPDLRG